MTNFSVSAAIDSKVASQAMLSHPFYQAWTEGRLPLAHYGIYTAGVVVMIVGLYLLLQGNAAMEPVVATGSIITLVGVLAFALVVFGKARAGARTAVPAE